MGANIEITINFYGYIRDVVSEEKTKLILPPSSTVGDMFKLLSEKYGSKFRERLLTSQGELQGTVAISIDNKVIDSLATKLGDELKEHNEINIMVIPMAAGGCNFASPPEADETIPA